jgi:uncharacterized protein YcbX
MPIATVARFALTPVKSTALQHPDAIDLRREGAVGDRRFLFARSDGTRLRGISKAPLMPIASTWLAAEERLIMRMPDGAVVEGSTHPVGERVDVKLFDRTIPARSIDPAFAEAIAPAVDETLSLLRVEEPEYAGGMHRASILSLASVADVGMRGGADPELDPRRFRMLIELDGLDPYEEDAWQGRRVRLGEAVIAVGVRMPRCVMTTLDPDTGEKNFDALKVLAKYRKVGTEVVLGVYGDVEEPGRIERGDPVEFLG